MQKKSLLNKEIFIHLGLHKTGTTFFQKELFNKIDNLDMKFRKQFIYDISTKSDKQKIIFTEEGYSVSMPHRRHEFECDEALLNLHKIFPNAKIIIGFRDKDSWLHSCYYQFIVSGGGFCSFEDYLRKYKDAVLDFDKYLLEIKSLWDDVFVYDFEDLKNVPDVLIRNLCDFIGCDIPEYENKRHNVSMNDNQLFFLKLINRMFTLNGRLPSYKIIEWLMIRLRQPEKLNQ